MLSALRLAVLVGLALSQVEAAKIKFVHRPASIAPPITYRQRMNCYISDEELSGTPRVGEETDKTLVQIVSITVLRNSGTKVAHVSQYKEAEVLADTDTNLSVEGDISGLSGNDAHLSLNYDHPLEEEAGAYTCDIVVKDEDGNQFTLSKTISVPRADPSIDLVIRELVTLHEQMRSRPLTLTQQGYGKCGASKDWRNGPVGSTLSSPKHKQIAINFEQNFRRKPIVRVGLTALDAMTGGSVRVQFEVKDVTTRGFTVDCITWSGAVVNEADFEWLALPAPIPQEEEKLE